MNNNVKMKIAVELGQIECYKYAIHYDIYWHLLESFFLNEIVFSLINLRRTIAQAG